MIKPGYEIGCYGKYPTAADFISYKADHPGAAGFTRWLDEAISLARARLEDDWLEHFPKMTPLGFVFRSNASSSYVAGSLFPSKDQSGRLFPFVTFLRSDTSALHGSTASIPQHLWDFIKAGAALTDQAPSNMDDLRRIVDELSMTIPSTDTSTDQRGRGNEPGPMNEWTIGELEQSLGCDGSVKVIRRISRNLLDIAPRFKIRPDRIPPLGFRFPMPADTDAVLPALCYWLETARVILGSGLPLPITFWTLSTGKPHGHLDLYYITPPPARFLLSLVPTLSSDNLYPLDEEDAPQRSSPNALIAGTMEQAAHPEEMLTSVIESLERAVGR